MAKKNKKLFKKLFIPHHENNFRPHFFENTFSIFFGIFMLIIFSISLNLPNILHFLANSQLSAVLPSVLIELTNEERQKFSLNLLKENELLSKAAQLKANDMALKQYFSHTNPEGKRPWHWLQDVGYKYQYAGENLAVNFFESKDVTVAWMNSPTHKANIIKSAYSEIGTGVATGTFNGAKTIYVAQVYASPAQNISGQSANVLEAFQFNTDPLKDFFVYLLYNNHDLTNKIFIAVLIFVIVALILNIFIKIQIQSWHLIRNAFLILILIISLLLINKYIEKNKLKGIQYSSFEYTLNQNGEHSIKNQ